MSDAATPLSAGLLAPAPGPRAREAWVGEAEVWLFKFLEALGLSAEGVEEETTTGKDLLVDRVVLRHPRLTVGLWARAGEKDCVTLIYEAGPAGAKTSCGMFYGRLSDAVDGALYEDRLLARCRWLAGLGPT